MNIFSLQFSQLQRLPTCEHVNDEGDARLVHSVLSTETHQLDGLQVVFNRQCACAAGVGCVGHKRQLAEAVKHQEWFSSGRCALNVVDIGCATSGGVAVDDHMFQDFSALTDKIGAKFGHPRNQAVFLKLTGVVHSGAKLADGQRLVGSPTAARGNGWCHATRVGILRARLRHLVEGWRGTHDGNHDGFTTLWHLHARNVTHDLRLQTNLVPKHGAVGHTDPLIAIVGQCALVEFIRLHRLHRLRYFSLGAAVLFGFAFIGIQQTDGKRPAQIFAGTFAHTATDALTFCSFKNAGGKRQILNAQAVKLGSVGKLCHMRCAAGRQSPCFGGFLFGCLQFGFKLFTLSLGGFLGGFGSSLGRSLGGIGDFLFSLLFSFDSGITFGKCRGYRLSNKILDLFKFHCLALHILTRLLVVRLACFCRCSPSCRCTVGTYSCIL